MIKTHWSIIIVITIIIVLLLVSSSLLPFRINIRTLVSPAHIELGFLRLLLLSFPFIKSELLGLLFLLGLLLDVSSGGGGLVTSLLLRGSVLVDSYVSVFSLLDINK